MTKSIVALTLTLFTAGCASGPPPRVVRVTDLGQAGKLEPGQSLVVEFREGDRLPLEFTMQGPLLETEKGTPPIMLRATRRFFLRIDEDGLRSSLDGKDFSLKPAAPGSFSVGFSATPAGAKANITIKGPTPKTPE